MAAALASGWTVALGHALGDGGFAYTKKCFAIALELPPK